jgi:hypothetical protein
VAARTSSPLGEPSAPIRPPESTAPPCERASPWCRRVAVAPPPEGRCHTRCDGPGLHDVYDAQFASTQNGLVRRPVQRPPALVGAVNAHDDLHSCRVLRSRGLMAASPRWNAARGVRCARPGRCQLDDSPVGFLQRSSDHPFEFPVAQRRSTTEASRRRDLMIRPRWSTGQGRVAVRVRALRQ